MQTDTSGVVESNSVDSSADNNGVKNFNISKNDGAARLVSIHTLSCTSDASATAQCT